MILKNYADWNHFLNQDNEEDIVDTDNTQQYMTQLQQNVENIEHPFACYGSIDIDDKNPPLLHVVQDQDQMKGKKENKHVKRALAFTIDSNLFNDEEIQQLKDLMKPAAFAYKNKTKFDPTYRNALQLPNTLFLFSFGTEKQKLNILHKIKNILMVDEEYDIFCEPYKLNFMSKGGFFKAHVDTPHGEDFFGTLVLCLPISKFEGGNLMIWDNDSEEKKVDCDFAKSLFNYKQYGDGDDRDGKKKQENAKIEWCAFYGDCGHEILKVTAGHRITITFNLYTKQIDAHLMTQHLLANKNDTFGIDPYNLLTFEQNLYFALMSCQFLPNGGKIGFGCTSKYPVGILNDNDVNIHMCKGVDGLIMSCIKKFNFAYSVVPVVDSNGRMLKESWFPDESSYAWIVDDGWDCSKRQLTELTDCQNDNYYRNVEIVNWLNDIEQYAEQGVQTQFYHGNEASESHYYVYAIILIKIPAFGQRIQSL